MRDDYLTADWARHHGDLTNAIRTALTTLRESFERLHAYNYDAPWRHDVIAKPSRRA